MRCFSFEHGQGKVFSISSNKEGLPFHGKSEIYEEAHHVFWHTPNVRDVTGS